MLISKSWI